PTCTAGGKQDVFRRPNARERKGNLDAFESFRRTALQTTVILLNGDRHLPQSGEVQIDRTRTQLATSWKRKLCTAHPGKDRTQKDNGRAHFSHQVRSFPGW